MQYIDEYREKDEVLLIAKEINKIIKSDLYLMEVCGGHTTAMHRFGLKSILSDKLHLLSGPGCPVCVTSIGYVDQLVAYSREENVIIATLGDLVRIPGSTSSLERERSAGADIRVIYSPTEALDIAKKNRDRIVVFPGTGFETTAPISAMIILEAFSQNINNLYMYSSHKVMPPAMEAIISDRTRLDGYICPGHVSTITGTDMYRSIATDYKVSCVVSGFEPLDLLQSIYMIIEQINSNSQRVEIQYKRAVKPEGNLKAKKIVQQVFTPRDDYWRGFGNLPLSGLKLSPAYERFDAETHVDVKVEKTIEPKGCICGKILRGQKLPVDCKLFGKICEPANPVGACMVSSEGTCAAYYKFRAA